MFLSMRSKRLLSLLLTPVLLAAIAAPIAAEAKKSEKVDYLALGNSLAAGQDPYRNINKGYTDFLAEKLDAIKYLQSFNKDFAVPGYTTQNVLDDIEENVEKNGESIRESIEGAELITIDAGANDLLQQLNISETSVSIDPSKVPDVMNQVSRNFKKILQEIRELNPSADIYVMGYYNSFPYIPKEQQKKLLPVLDKLNSTIAKTLSSSRARANYVPTSKVIDANYREYLPNPRDIHPSEAGYQAIADEFWKKMRRDYSAKKLIVNESRLELMVGQEAELTLTAEYPHGDSVLVNEQAVWRSSNEGVATVDDGEITANKEGSTRITAVYDGRRVTIYVKVKE